MKLLRKVTEEGDEELSGVVSSTATVVAAGDILLEDGTKLLLEDGTNALLEN